MDGMYVENAGAIFYLLLNHQQSYPHQRYRFSSNSLIQVDDSYMPRLGRPVASLVIYRWHVKQISPDKNMNFLCTAASFTVAVKSRGFDVLCHLASSLRLI